MTEHALVQICTECGAIHYTVLGKCLPPEADPRYQAGRA